MLGIILFIAIICLVVFVGNIQEKSDKNKSTNQEKNPENFEEKKSLFKHETNNHFFGEFLDQYILKYEYSEQNIAGSKYENIDYSKLNINSRLNFIEEPDNQYDANAIKIYQDDMFLGYVHKGLIQDMLKKYLHKDEYWCLAYLNLIDEENKKLTYQIAFYKKFNENDYNIEKTIKATLIKTTKKSEEYESSRQEHLSILNEEDFVRLEEQFDTENLLVTNDIGEELGELNENVSDKLRDYINNNDYKIISKVTEITENNSGNYGAKIEFIIINN